MPKESFHTPKHNDLEFRPLKKKKKTKLQERKWRDVCIYFVSKKKAKLSICIQWVLLDLLLHLFYQISLQQFLLFPQNNKNHEPHAKWWVSHDLLQLLSLKLLRGFNSYYEMMQRIISMC